MATFAGGQTYNPGSAGKIKLPNVPEAQMAEPLPINYPPVPDPYDYFRIQNRMFKQGLEQYPQMINAQMAMLPQITQAQMAAQQQVFPLQLAQQQQASQHAFNEQMRQYGIAGPQLAYQQADLMSKLAPQFGNTMRTEAWTTGQQLQNMATAYNPQFMPTYNALGKRIGEGLTAGYELGSDLEREVEQGIRAAQTSRGNYLGPAPTAAEAFGKGHAALDLYNTRLGQAQNFLQGKQPGDLWAAMMPAFGQAGGYADMALKGAPQIGIMSPVAPTTAGLAAQGVANFLQPPDIQLAQKLAPNVYGTYQSALGQWGQTSVGGQGEYNKALIGAADVNNSGMFNMYDRQFDQFLFDQGVSQGIYSQPGSSGAGAMGAIGSGIGALGSIGGGLASAGVFGGGAAGAAGAAGGAAGAAGAAGGLGGALAGAGTAIAGGVSAAAGAVGAAASAAAAAFACWLARAVIPERWKEFREFLFTKAPPSFRRAYLYGARRLANGLTEADKAQIREVMEKCLK